MYSAGRNPDEFLNRYLTENMVACSRKPDKANLKVIWQPQYRIRGLMPNGLLPGSKNGVAERSAGRTAFEAEIF
jgi:hypothetical protein